MVHSRVVAVHAWIVAKGCEIIISNDLAEFSWMHQKFRVPSILCRHIGSCNQIGFAPFKIPETSSFPLGRQYCGVPPHCKYAPELHGADHDGEKLKFPQPMLAFKLECYGSLIRNSYHAIWSLEYSSLLPCFSCHGDDWYTKLQLSRSRLLDCHRRRCQAYRVRSTLFYERWSRQLIMFSGCLLSSSEAWMTMGPERLMISMSLSSSFGYLWSSRLSMTKFCHPISPCLGYYRRSYLSSTTYLIQLIQLARLGEESIAHHHSFRLI